MTTMNTPHPTRRNFLLPLLGPLAAHRLRAAQDAPAMKITRVETLYWKTREAAPWRPNWIWLRLHTDSGHQGLGETFPRNAVEASMVHSILAPMLIGRDPRDIDRIWMDLYRAFDFHITGGVESRVLSALDLALWDLLGNALGVPVYRLIGGRSNPRFRVYNTSYPYKYDFNTEPEKIMRELIDRYGVKAIKIWPFDGAARRNNYQFITAADLEEGLRPVRRLREKFGGGIEILMEFHSGWNLPSAVRIAKALEPYKPMWLEDMMPSGNFQQYRQLAGETSLPICLGERLTGRPQFLQLLESRAAKYVMFDLCWCGGLSEARKIGAMAEAYQLPVAPHTAAGALLFYASAHLSTAATNLWIQESVQRFYESDWPAILENPIIPSNGTVAVPELPGFGMRIKPAIWDHPAAVRQVTNL